MSPATKAYLLLLAIALAAASAQQYVAFDAASATSTYSAGNLAGSSAFAAQQALSGGSGYWCSSGSHGAGNGVTWTGLLNSRRTALGLKVDWAYAPGEVKIMTSSDGANFEEAKCWQPTGRGEAAFEESFMFDAPRSVKAVAVAMRGSQSWGYFGINSAALIAEPGPFMLVSGITSGAGEQCLVAGASGVSLQPCLLAIAAGDGREVMELDKDGQIANMADGTCITLVDGDTASGGAFAMEECSSNAESTDGRTVFAVTAGGQLKMPRLGNFCMTMLGDAGLARAVVQDCAEAEDNTDSRDKFFMVAVPEFDPRAAAAAKQQAALLAAAGEHLGGLVAELHAAMPSLAACGFKASLAKRTHSTMKTKSEVQLRAAATDANSVAVAAVAPALGLDMQALHTLIASTQETLAQIASS